ncbi:IclR family transcriptional regulator [Mesobacillus maritimus]|uniref:IclR family transcriptional regulator n=1 Tax=Mesobacillus maritimus TaxID=1643336 RepID=UPI00384CF825
MKKSNKSLVTERTLNVLMLFATEKELSVSQIASLLDENISSVYRIVNTMEAQDFIEQKSNKKYTLKTPNILKLYNMVSKEIREYAKPVLISIVERFKESVYLSELYEQENIMIIEKQDSPNRLKWTENIGHVYHIPTGTGGKTHLAYIVRNMDEKQKTEYLSKLKLTKYTAKSITDVSELRKSIDQIVADGYCITEGEHVEEIVGIAVPVFNSINDECRHVLSMVMTASRFDPSKKDAYIHALQEGAKRIGQNLSN